MQANSRGGLLVIVLEWVGMRSGAGDDGEGGVPELGVGVVNGVVVVGVMIGVGGATGGVIERKLGIGMGVGKGTGGRVSDSGKDDVVVKGELRV